MASRRSTTNVSLRPAASYAGVVGQVLVQARQEMGLGQAELAAAVGVSQPTWSRIERGSQALTIEQLHAAAKKLRVPPSEILTRAERVSEHLRSQGVRVTSHREVDPAEGLVAIGLAALAVMTIAALTKK